jgi:hypothetical protein
MTTKIKNGVKKSFKEPDETRDFERHGRLEVLNLSSDLVVGRGIFEPGWRWSNDVKPIAGTQSCMAEHYGYCVKGSMTVRMDDGEILNVRAGEAFYLAPGHDAWVEGNETCEMLDFAGYKDYAKRKPESEAA